MRKSHTFGKRIAGTVAVFGMLLIPSLGCTESLKDGVILRDNAAVVLKNGSTVRCSRIVWLVSAADFVQCDKGDHAVEIKIRDLNFEKTFGPALAREYADMKDHLADAHEKSRQRQESDKVTYESPMNRETEGEPMADGPSAPLEAAAEGDAKEGDAPETLDAALQALSDGGSVKAYNAAQAIAGQAKAGADCSRAITPLITQLDDERPVRVISSGSGFSGGSAFSRSVGDAAKYALVSIGAPAVPALIERVKENRPGSARAGDKQAILALGEIGDTRAVEVLTRHAQDSGLVHRRDAVRALVQIKGPDAWEGLAAIMGSQDGRVRLEAAWGLHTMDPARAPGAIDPHMDAMLADAEGNEIRSAINLAGSCGFKRLAPAFVRYLDHEDPMAVSMALSALAKVGAPADALPRLVELAAVKKTNDHATQAIRAIRDPAATNGLIQCVTHSDAKVRQASAQALGEIGQTQAVPALAKALADDDLETRHAAVWALGRIPGAESTAALRDAANSEDSKISMIARGQLRKRSAAE